MVGRGGFKIYFQNQYVIKKHDIIKLGRMKFRVKEFRTKDEYFEDLDNETTPHPGFDEIYEVERSKDTETKLRLDDDLLAIATLL